MVSTEFPRISFKRLLFSCFKVSLILFQLSEVRGQESVGFITFQSFPRAKHISSTSLISSFPRAKHIFLLFLPSTVRGYLHLKVHSTFTRSASRDRSIILLAKTRSQHPQTLCVQYVVLRPAYRDLQSHFRDAIPRVGRPLHRPRILHTMSVPRLDRVGHSDVHRYPSRSKSNSCHRICTARHLQ